MNVFAVNEPLWLRVTIPANSRWCAERFQADGASAPLIISRMDSDGFGDDGWAISSSRKCGLRTTALAISALWVGACTPVMDWREVHPAGTRLQFLFPCKPTSQERQVTLAGSPVQLSLLACKAGDVTWAVSMADVTDPARVVPSLDELKATSEVKMGRPAGAWTAMTVPGATPSAATGRAYFATVDPAGRSFQMHVAVFSQGTLVFQVSALGENVPVEAAETFRSSVRVVP